VRAALCHTSEHHSRQQVTEAEAAERERHVRPHHERRREQREQREREHHADTEEDRQRFVAPIPGLHEPQPEAAQLLRRARRLLTDPLQQAEDVLEARFLLFLDDIAPGHQLFEPAIDRGRLGHHHERHGGHQHRAEDESE
jgi:hypothetical protein